MEQEKQQGEVGQPDTEKSVQVERIFEEGVQLFKLDFVDGVYTESGLYELMQSLIQFAGSTFPPKIKISFGVVKEHKSIWVESNWKLWWEKNKHHFPCHLDSILSKE